MSMMCLRAATFSLSVVASSRFSWSHTSTVALVSSSCRVYKFRIVDLDPKPTLDRNRIRSRLEKNNIGSRADPPEETGYRADPRKKPDPELT